jgi:hypothetical protein
LRARLIRVCLANGIVVRRSNGVRRSVLVANSTGFLRAFDSFYSPQEPANV